jgi:NAD(P)H-flavin reductase
VLLTLPIRDVLVATPRARIVRIALNGRTLPYAPGQAVLIANHGQDKRRPYSIASSPEDAERDRLIELLVGVNEDGQAGPHLTLLPGTLVDLEGPLGRFTFPEQPLERRFLFIAGGRGIAPLRSMLRHALHIPDAHVGVLYSARTASEFAYESELRELARGGRIELKQTVTRDLDETWSGQRGRIGRDDLMPLVHGRETLCFICGPTPFVSDMVTTLGELGVARERIKIEEWT